MKRRLWIGVALTVAAAVLWGLAARALAVPLAVTAATAIAAVICAWWVPLWWLVETLLAAIARGLDHVVGALDEAKATGAAVATTTSEWLRRAAEWSLKNYGAPPWLVELAPVLADFVAPFLEQPLSTAAQAAAAGAHAYVRVWRFRLAAVRGLWAVVGLGPTMVAPVAWITYESITKGS